MKRSGWKPYIITLVLIAAVLMPFMLHPVLRTMEPQVVHYNMDFGGLDGRLETDVEAGDVITVDGRISMSYSPDTFSGGTPSASRVSVDVGDTMLTVGRLNE